MIAATERLRWWAGRGGLLGVFLALGCGDESSSTGDAAAGAIGAGVGAAPGIGATGAAGESGSGGGGGDRGGVGGSGTGGSTLVFITTNGQSFEAEGQRHTFVGTNFWPGMNLGAAGASGDRDRLNRELDRLQALGITNLRVMAASEGPDGEPYRLVPALMPSPGVYNEEIFQGLDYLLDAMAQRGMRAVMVLNNYWEWSGGMAQYVNWDTDMPIPYPLVGNNYQRFLEYAAQFYECSSCQDAYRAHIHTVVHRVNTINGAVYRDDPAIFSWELANEPRGYPARWIGDVAGYIKSMDSNHLVTTGSEGSWAGDFVRTHQSSDIDYATCHIWVENWGYYDAGDSGQSNYRTAVSFALDYLDQSEGYAQNLNKPLVLEEFGMARDGWTAEGKYDPAATTTRRNAYFTELYAAVETSASNGGALAGDNFWAWGGEARPPSAWTGDPPHEEPGWYSVYDADQPTLSIIQRHALNLAP